MLHANVPPTGNKNWIESTVPLSPSAVVCEVALPPIVIVQLGFPVEVVLAEIIVGYVLAVKLKVVPVSMAEEVF